jgi:hypothetical protein
MMSNPGANRAADHLIMVDVAVAQLLERVAALHQVGLRGACRQ